MAKKIPSVHGRNTIETSPTERYRWMAYLTLPKDYEMDVTPSQQYNDVDFLADLGRGKMASYEFNDDEAANYYAAGVGEEYGGDLRVTGEASTPGRARIAQEAMENRIIEGRNLRTGRPKK